MGALSNISSRYRVSSIPPPLLAFVNYFSTSRFIVASWRAQGTHIYIYIYIRGLGYVGEKSGRSRERPPGTAWRLLYYVYRNIVGTINIISLLLSYSKWATTTRAV